MTRLGDTLLKMHIGGSTYPTAVEAVMSGTMQARYAHSRTKAEKDILVHPDYMFGTVARTCHAILGAFTLRLIGKDGMTVDDLEDYQTSTDKVPQLELLGNDPIPYKLFSVMGGMNFLKITKLVQIKDGLVSARGLGTELLEAHPRQPYTVYPEELRQTTSQGIGCEYIYMPIGPTSTEIAAMVYQQYSPRYNNLQSLD